MAVRSIIDIEVNDSDFQRYASAFGKYQEELRDQPGIWSKVSEGAGDAAKAAAEMGTAVGAAFFALHKISGENSQMTRNTERQSSAWSSMANSASKFASRVLEATRSLLRWGELTGLISGILGGGGLYGIDRLAIDATQQRSRAFQLSGTPGEVAAAKVDLARFTDPNSFMSKINTGLNNVSSPQYLAMMNAGVDPSKQTDAANAAFNTMVALKDAVDKIPKGPLFGETTHAFKYDELMPPEDLIKLRNMSREEVVTQATRGREDTARLEINPQQTRIWNDLQTSFERVAAILKRDLIVRLTDLAPALERLSGSFLHLAEIVLNNPNMEKWIKGAAEEIDKFASFLGGDKIGNSVDWIMSKLDVVFEKIKHVVDEIPKIPDGFQEAVGIVIDAFKLLWQTMDDMGRSIAKVAHMIIDPIIDPAKNAWSKLRNWWGGDTNSDISNDNHEQSPPSLWDRTKDLWHRSFGSDGIEAHKTSYRVGGDSFEQIEANNNLPSGFLQAVEKTESNGRDVSSPAGAQGYFQFMPRTAERFGVDPHDEMSSARGAGNYYRELLEEFHGDIAKATAGYNWGEGNVEKDVAQYGDRWREHLPDETKAYVDLVLRRTEQNQIAQQTGPRFVPNQGRPSSVAINVNNQTGGNSYISASQLSVA